MANRSRKTSNRGASKNGIFGKAMGIAIAGAFFVGFFQIPTHPTTQGFANSVSDRAVTASAWIDDLYKTLTGVTDDASEYLDGDGGDSSSSASPQKLNRKVLAAQQVQLRNLDVAAAAKIGYDRSQWRQWDNITGCWTVREQVLYQDAAKNDALTLLDKNKQRTKNVKAACYITGGDWVDPYTGQKFTNPEDLDIDHMVPLGYAAAHNGQAWSSSKKEDYANAYKEPGHLLAVSASANRSKSDRGPSQWKPSNKSYWCQYAIDWVEVTTKWRISVTKTDKSALTEMLNTCKV